MRIRLSFGFLMIAAIFVIGGCSTGTNPTTDDADLEDFGSYKATDEEPFFGDADLGELSTEEETEFDDPAALSPTITDMENDTGHYRPDMFSFRMIWGNLNRDSGITELTDWSGKLTLSRGHVIVTRTIRFEPGQDYVQPRITLYPPPPEVQWTSWTAGHFDGLATKIFNPHRPDMNMEPDEPLIVTYESEHLTISFELNQLDELDTLISLGPGNAISFQAMRYEPREVHGGLIGRWGRDDAGRGFFYGLWRASNGRLMGALRGHWGTDDNGHQIFLGKWIDHAGRFRGFVKGNWTGEDGNDLVDGRFTGRIFNASREPIGLMGGHYKKAEYRRGGFFSGRWCIGCQPMISNDGS